MVNHDEVRQDAERANESYMVRLEAERKSRLERNNELAQKIKEVGKILGDWSFIDKRGAEWLDTPCPSFELNKRDGESLRLYLDQTGRLTISGIQPEGPSVTRWDGYRISVDPEKPAKKIASDIERRLLAEYLPAFQASAEERANYFVIADLAQKKAEEIAEAFGTTARKASAGEWKIYTNKTGVGALTIVISATSNGWTTRVEGSISSSTLDALLGHARTVK